MSTSEPTAPEPLGAVPPDDERLVGLRQILWLMDRLRGEGGCPWDRAQDARSLRTYLLEECYELLEAIDEGDEQGTREELGDVLFQVVFHARVAQDEGKFHVGDVGHGIATKLLERHPHVFGGAEALASPAAVEKVWEQHKLRAGRRSVLDGVPAQLPALLRAQRVQEKAARVGFDWHDPRGPLGKLREELGELEAEVEAKASKDRLEHELGDLLFSAVNLARHLGIDAEQALRVGVARFERRFRHVEQAAGSDLTAHTLEELDRLWDAAKRAERTDEP